MNRTQANTLDTKDLITMINELSRGTALDQCLFSGNVTIVQSSHYSGLNATANISYKGRDRYWMLAIAALMIIVSPLSVAFIFWSCDAPTCDYCFNYGPDLSPSDYCNLATLPEIECSIHAPSKFNFLRVESHSISSSRKPPLWRAVMHSHIINNLLVMSIFYGLDLIKFLYSKPVNH